MIEIEDIKIQLGSTKEKNNIIEKKFSLKKGSIFNLTGIKQRSIANNLETAESLAIKACKKIDKIKLKKISHIISVSNTQTLRFPGISNHISSIFDLKKTHCLNLNQGCTGFVDALQVSYEIIKNNKNSKILLITSDTYTKFINKNNRAVRCLFSDGAAAVLVKYKKNGLKIKKNIFINIKNTINDLYFNKNEILMNGPAVVAFAVKDVIPEIVKLSKDVDCIFSHQAGKIVMGQIKKKINNKVFFPINFNNHGNLVSTSIPLLLKENMKKFKKEKKILICGFGVGLSAAITLLHR